MWSVFFVFLSYLDRNRVKGDFLSRSLDAEKPDKEMISTPLNDTFCSKMSSLGENFLYQVSNGTEVVRSVVSPAGKLMHCSIIANQMQVKSFMHECRLALNGRRAGQLLETRFARVDEAKLMCREFKERSARSGVVGKQDANDSGLQHELLKRSKRGFTYPGTLWCGAGNLADDYDQLGDFAETDSCCRIHDHCPHVIHAFSSNYGHINFKWHSICHCDCDNALKDCLRKVNDTSSRVVGQAFFNVIGVPCFEFAYEEQCTERHWYGLCKRYDKLPTAVLKEAVPYDYGGIDVIDELTIAPPKKKDSKKAKGEKPENSTLSTVPGPEEPSLTNVVTVAEDFIKVLATVTSQSSTTDSDKSQTHNSEKKKRKNTGKKKKTPKKQKGKGKGRKRKQKSEAAVKVEEGAGVSPSGSKAGEVLALSNFIEPHSRGQSSRNRVGVSEYELRGKDEASNEVMKDEPAVDKETVSMTSPTTVQKEPAETHKDTEETTRSMSTTVTTGMGHKHRHRRPRKERRKTSKTQDTDTTDNSSSLSAPAIIITSTPSVQSQQQSHVEIQPIPTTTSASKAKKNRPKDKEEKVRRKKRRKLSSDSPIVASGHENTPAGILKVIPLNGAPTVPSLPTTTEQQDSHRLAVSRGRTSLRTALNSSFSVSKGQRSTEGGLRNKRRKSVSLLSGEKSLLLVLPTSGEVNSPAHASAFTDEPNAHSEWRLHPAAADIISPKNHRQTIRQQRKLRRKVAAAAAGVFIPEETEPALTFVATAEEQSLYTPGNPYTTTSRTPVMSPIQLSINRAEAQFSKKKKKKKKQKRNKAAMSVRQQ